MKGDNGDWPKISVVTPSFNQGQYIEATIKSVLEQGYPNLEYIIMDGGSTDGTVEIIEKYSDQLTYWVSEPDEGQTDALIKGFNRASGDILCWLCSDDLFEARTLQEVAEMFVQHPDWEVVYGDSFWIDADGRPIRFKREIPYYRFIWMYDHNYLPQPSTFWRRGIYERVDGLDARMELSMDADLWSRFAEHTALHHVPLAWSRMRYYPEQKNRRLRTKSNQEDGLIRSRYLPDEPRWLRRLKWFLAKGLRVALKLARGAYW
ncbi:MAG: glycosyltransferase [Rubrobacteraceae bacterium]|nr:glycosyltransferase [Rubrobacteraceae bacterium]